MTEIQQFVKERYKVDLTDENLHSIGTPVVEMWMKAWAEHQKPTEEQTTATLDQIEDWVDDYIREKGYKMHDLALERDCIMSSQVMHCIEEALRRFGILQYEATQNSK